MQLQGNIEYQPIFQTSAISYSIFFFALTPHIGKIKKSNRSSQNNSRKKYPAYFVVYSYIQITSWQRWCAGTVLLNINENYTSRFNRDYLYIHLNQGVSPRLAEVPWFFWDENKTFWICKIWWGKYSGILGRGYNDFSKRCTETTNTIY